ncbi:MAG: hypothetical protein J5954_01460 [Prevotella sp.]|nr:hypothetical protein [Prevotella sp.]MBO6255267.1 hypothetical protein [Bacteroidaceae bacterium]
MRKILYSLLALLVISLENHAQTVSVSNDVEALSSGETVSFVLHINGVETMTSTHFEVIAPDGFSVTEVTPTTDWSAMFSEKEGVVGAISTTTHALMGEGDIAVIKMEVPEGTAEGSYPVTISNFRVNGKTLDITAEVQVKVTNETTAIQLANSHRQMSDERVYNIGGLPTTATSKGIKIKKGRKVIITGP